MTTADLTARASTTQPNSAVVGKRHKRPKPRRLAVRILLYLLQAATIAVFVIPIYWLFSSAVKPSSDIYTYPLQWIPNALHLENFLEAWRVAPFDRFFLNSLITTGVGTALEILLALLSAYAFAMVRFRWKTPVLLLIIGSMMLPGHVTLLVNYITIGNLGWLNTYQGLILPSIGSAFAMFLIYQQMRMLPRDVIDAARIDGAGHARRLFSVVIPMCRAMILTATLITLASKWNDFIWPLISTSTTEMRTLPIGLMFLRDQEGGGDWGAVMAGAVTVVAPMLLLFFIAQKRIVGGLTGAVKG